jgi:uncharacterized C2H2 Zn-finger protein
VVRCPKCGSEKVRALRGNKYLCEYCYYTFYACPVCGETFAYAWQLSSHMRKHRKRGEREELRALLEELLAGQRLVLAKLEEVSGKLDRVLELLSAKAPIPAPAAELPGEELPDFLRDNPWLSILRSRGGGR